METKRLSKEEFAQKMKEKRSVLFNKADNQLSITVSDKDKYLEFLRVLARHNYTVTNTLLIQAQNPNATFLKDVARWREDGFYIKKNEKGIGIFEPSKPFMRRDGTQGVNYNVKYIFDITQTSADIIPSISYPSSTELEFAFKHKEKNVVDRNPNMNQLDYLTSTLFQIVKDEAGQLDEFIVASCAYALASKYGLQVTESFAYSANSYFAHLNPKVIKGKLCSIKELFDIISKRIEHGLYVYAKENTQHD